MKIIGTDEAGYGPNFGPLVVSATCWTANENDFDGFSETLTASGIGIGDSKKIYHAGGTLAPLESVVLATLRSIGVESRSDVELYRDLTDRIPSDFTFSEPEISLPVETDSERIEEIAMKFRKASKQCGVRLERIRSRTIFPTEFNTMLSRFDSKASLLSDTTLRLAVGLMTEFPEEDFLILCDKHGGRNRYLDLLHGFFPDEMIWTDQESRSSSVYRFEQGTRRAEFRFQMKGESLQPIALASMVSKFLRETAMLRFNRFWQARIPNLKPTAGYPEDARRFKQDIAAVQTALKIDDKDLWREK